ncbi:hypothetical protein RvY_11713 [Ramazzottius varieornatus]|uniref:Uncharacterized protein n=2 Tax=Ramazzottius varieornatus TaxID=947166 RepID=A0A1D1VJ22_RAMVA|nr:hypothetical protein RvY_11713 [Ramazzottius varieornatus]
MDVFVKDGLNVTAARSPTGHCFTHPFANGAQSCVCASAEACNNKPFIGKNMIKQYVASYVRPDAQGNLPTGTGTGTGSGSGSNPGGGGGASGGASGGGSGDPSGSGGGNGGDTVALDASNQTGSEAGGSQAGSSGCGKLYATAGFCVLVVFATLL